MIARLATGQKISEIRKSLEGVGCTVKHDREAGTIIAKDGDTVVFRAIQKSPNGPWIAIYRNSDRIKWEDTQGHERRDQADQRHYSTND